MELSAVNCSEQKRTPKTCHTKSSSFKDTSLKCSLCKNTHYLSRCFKFLKLNDKARFDFVCKHKLCKNCLSEFHVDSNCSSKRNCGTCNKRHHTLIHSQFSSQQNNSEHSNASEASNSNGSFSSSNNSNNNQSRTYHIGSNNNKITLLGTAQLKIFNNKGHYITVRALVDPCSDESYVTESTLRLLGLGKYYSPTSVSVIGEQSVGTCSHRSDFLIGSLYNSFKSFMSAKSGENYHLRFTTQNCSIRRINILGWFIFSRSFV